MEDKLNSEFSEAGQKDSKTRPDYENEIIGVIRSNISPKIMRDKLDDYHRNDIAEVLDELTLKERKKLYRILDEEMLSEIFEYVDTDDAALYINEMDLLKGSAIISKLEPDTAVEILKEIDKVK
jgi:magnesium transporter